ncbi:hypothetical protein BPJM79_30344 [Bacillus pumilus]
MAAFSFLFLLKAYECSNKFAYNKGNYMILNDKRCEHEVYILSPHLHMFAPEWMPNRDEAI